MRANWLYYSCKDQGKNNNKEAYKRQSVFFSKAGQCFIVCIKLKDPGRRRIFQKEGPACGKAWRQER